MFTTTYNTIQQPAVAEMKDKGSRFIGCAFPFTNKEQLKVILEQLKATYPKATHYCYAYRIGVDGNSFRVNDDGEPSGSAGKPILGVIDSKQITNVLIVVVRYFGGTLLGVPGLISAYKSAAALAIQMVPAVQKNIEKQYLIQCDYTILNNVMVIIKQFECTVIKQEIQLFCTLTVGIPVNRLENVLFRLKEIYSIEIKEL